MSQRRTEARRAAAGAPVLDDVSAALPGEALAETTFGRLLEEF